MTVMSMTIPRQRAVVRRAAQKPRRATPFLDLLWMVPLAVASYTVAFVVGAWVEGLIGAWS